MWEPDVGTMFLEPGAETGCRNQMWELGVVNGCGNRMWEPDFGSCVFGTWFREPRVGTGVRNQVFGTLLVVVDS